MINRPEPLDKEKHVANTKSIMCKTDTDGHIEYANEYFVELAGYDEGEIMGESLDIISHPETPKLISKYIWEQINKKHKVYAIIKYLSKSGHFYWLQLKFDYKVSEVTREVINIYLYASVPSRNAILELEKFYKKLTKIETESNLEIAKKYFNGYLENSNLTYDSFIEKYLQT
ncbi:MAG: PAS domain-containing protein [Flavobacteriaceae bacterium]|nr:PAS domain-containing protein [Flavobacteriaceae bacterium]